MFWAWLAPAEVLLVERAGWPDRQFLTTQSGKEPHSEDRRRPICAV